MRTRSLLLATLGALLAGSRTDEGIQIGRLLERGAGSQGVKVPGYPVCAEITSVVRTACATARLTEIDDIHLASCTTPGSVVIPTALALASAGKLRTVREFAAAVTAGYELLIRLGYAVNGPRILQHKLWPTYFAAAFGSAATASRAYGLSIAKTAGALATAFTFCTGTTVPLRSPASSRWLTLGTAAANGLLSARAAAEGILGGGDMLERCGGRISGLRVSTPRLLGGLGHRYLFEEIGTKPYPVARQALAAIEACRELVDAERLDINRIDEILVCVPRAQCMIIDRPAMPETRLDSISSVQYQIALALLAPDRLLDVRRTPPFGNDPLRELMTKVRVRQAPELETYYPAAWPARVVVKAGGRRISHQLLYPRGDARNRSSWDDAIGKFRTTVGPLLGVKTANRVACQVRRLDPTAGMPRLWELSARER